MSYFVPGGGLAVCQQIGANQTDVFSVNQDGQLTVSWVVGGGGWEGPAAIGPRGIANPGSHVAASHQFGLNRTAAFLIDKNGQLNVFWVDNQGGWEGPEVLGEQGMVAAGTYLVASQQSGLNRTSVFFIGAYGQLYQAWVDGGGVWQGPEKVGPVDFNVFSSFLAVCQHPGINRTDLLAFDSNGQLNVFSSDGGGAWQGPVKIGQPGTIGTPTFLVVSPLFGTDEIRAYFIDARGGVEYYVVDSGDVWGEIPLGVKPGSFLAISQQFGLNQTDIFVVDDKGQLNVLWEDSTGHRHGPVPVGPASIAAPGAFLAASQQFGLNQTDVFLIDQKGRLNVFWVDNAGPWNGPLVRPNPVSLAPPSSGPGHTKFPG